MHFRSSRRAAAGLAFVLPLAVSGIVPACGQGIVTGSITGTVGDPTGAVIPGATVTLTDTTKGVKRTVSSGSDGAFSFGDLPIGSYTVMITGGGFSPLTLSNVEVDANRVQSLGLKKLVTGSANETVEVSSAANLLETSEAQVTTSFDTQQVETLPVAGGFDELALLIPGVVSTHADNFSNTNGANFSVNGQRGRANNFELDGQSNNDNSIGGPQAFFGSEEAIAQVQVITNDFGAQYGRNAGSVVNYLTRSGTNQFHGSAIYNYSGDFTSSLSQGLSKGDQFGYPANPTHPRYVQNYFGGTLGGPIIKDKLFAFGSTYFFRLAEFGALTSSGQSLFPTPDGLAQLVAAFPNSPGVAALQSVNPFAVTTGNPIATGSPINETISSGGKTLSVPFTQYARQIPSLDTDQEDLGRIDWQATPKDRFFVRYFYQHEPSTPGDDLANGGFYNVDDRIQSIGTDLTHTFGPHWVNQLRYSFQQSTLAFLAGGYTNCNLTNFTGCPSSISVGGTLSDGSTVGGLGLASNLPQGRIVKNGQVQDNVTWSLGKHSILFGGEFDYSNSPNTFLPDTSGVYTFDSFSDLVTGSCPTGVSCTAQVAVGNPVIPFKEEDVALYFQDDWKVAPSFTFNLGLRWEFFQQAINLLHNESVASQTGPNPLWSTALPLSQTTSPAVPDYYKNVEPRFGFAWNPESHKKLVIRGGYAINVDPAFYNINLNVATSAPLVVFGSVPCTTGGASCLPTTGGTTFATAQSYTAKLVPTGGNPGLQNQTTVAPNFRNPLGQTFTLAAEYQIQNSAVFEVRYTGNHGSRQYQSLNADPYLLNVATDFPNVVNPASLCSATNSTLAGGADIGHLSCGHTVVDQVANTAFSNYQSLQLNLTTKAYHGVTATFAYTHSNLVDNVSEIYSNTGSGGNVSAYAQNPLNTNYGERGTSAIDFPNTASASFIYDFPSLHSGSGLLNRLTSGWKTTAIYLYNSGQPYADYENLTSSSPQANFGTTDATTGAQILPGDPRTQVSYSDPVFGGNYLGFDVARPIISNPKASAQTLGIYTDTTLSVNAAGTPTFSAPQLVDYKTGAVVTPSQVRFIANNELAAQVLGNPYPGGGRNPLRADTFNNVDLNFFKDTHITERFTFRLEAAAFNVLNRAELSTPGNSLADYAGSPSSFNNFYYSYAQGSNVGPGSFGTGVRSMLFKAKILF